MARKPTAVPGGGGLGIWGHAGPSDFYSKAKMKNPNAIPGGSPLPLDRTSKPGLVYGAGLLYGAGHTSGELDDTSRKILPAGSGTSIFDPVLCEIIYRWFSPPGATVLDPFAGGSVRGIVASKLGRRYVGHELRAEQVAANREQGAALCANDDYPPVWICGDSRTMDQTCADVDADLLFTCPPYADLEVYSDDPLDISTMDYLNFKAAYFEIIRKSCDRLKPDSFACCVVGEVMDKRGNYLNFVGDTVQAFRDAGLEYYNEAILVTAVGSLPIRVGKQFSSGRKLGKTHQNVLIFVKGDGKRAATRCGDVEVYDALLNDNDAIKQAAKHPAGTPQ